MDGFTRIEELVEMLTPEELAELIRKLKEKKDDREECEKNTTADDHTG